MMKLLNNRKLSYWLGFILLPIFLTLICLVIGMLAPAALGFPKPGVIIEEIWRSLGDRNVQNTLLITLSNLLLSISISLLLGILLGFLCGYSVTGWNLSEPTIDFLRSVPVTFLIPAGALLYGSTSTTLIWVLSTYPSALIIIFNIRSGIRNQDLERLHSFKIFSNNKSSWKAFKSVSLKEILPFLFTGLRISISYCLIVITVSEYILKGGNAGIGGLVYDEQSLNHYPRIYALLFIIGLIGFLFNKLVEAIETFFMKWIKFSEYE